MVCLPGDAGEETRRQKLEGRNELRSGGIPWTRLRPACAGAKYEVEVGGSGERAEVPVARD